MKKIIIEKKAKAKKNYKKTEGCVALKKIDLLKILKQLKKKY